MRAHIETFIRPIRHHLLSVMFLCGFVVDNFTLNRVDQILDNAILLGYVALAMGALACLYLGISGKLSERWSVYATRFAPLAVQYAFGGLMSGMLVFYSRSGSWYTSWPYLFVIIAIILGNELITKRAQRLVFNISVLFIGIFSYAALIVPVVLGKMSDTIFVLSGVGALVVISAFIRVLYVIVPNFMALNTRAVFFIVGMIFFSLNALYFANLIPPIPLSLKDIGVYHSVDKLSDGVYRLTFEEGAWYEFWKESDNTFHLKGSSRVYCYASVFAPTRLATTIYHRWEYYDSEKGWVFHERIPYSISGGRGEGYRGYSYIESARDGLWRCSVENGRGQTVGRDMFTIVTSEAPTALVTRVDI